MGYVILLFFIFNRITDNQKGIFAGNKKIPSGTFIGIYSGELLLDEEAHDRGKFVTHVFPNFLPIDIVSKVLQ